MPQKILKESKKGLIVNKSQKNEPGVQEYTVYTEAEKIKFVEQLYMKIYHDIEKLERNILYSRPTEQHLKEFATKIVKESEIL